MYTLLPVSAYLENRCRWPVWWYIISDNKSMLMMILMMINQCWWRFGWSQTDDDGNDKLMLLMMIMMLMLMIIMLMILILMMLILLYWFQWQWFCWWQTYHDGYKGSLSIPKWMNFRKISEGGGGGVISDLKNFIANLVLVQPGCGKNRNIFVKVGHFRLHFSTYP